jgi:hypothetical protein
MIYSNCKASPSTVECLMVTQKGQNMKWHINNCIIDIELVCTWSFVIPRFIRPSLVQTSITAAIRSVVSETGHGHRRRVMNFPSPLRPTCIHFMRLMSSRHHIMCEIGSSELWAWSRSVATPGAGPTRDKKKKEMKEFQKTVAVCAVAGNCNNDLLKHWK